ncbi:acyltransferase family protein [Rhizobium wuzhouense]|uniref:Acyltransferase 3 domain-containing protein n=1 Tax=Rhizobium wuzhouense TaxID=1986026 RepID=A0ABX5NMD7_9HYPH|nr:acyltransferase [Rhizobium wuzhouense]PYB71263.1 hypothetical protein DMY87_18035 [Rhizobium wuzhouense]
MSDNSSSDSRNQGLQAARGMAAFAVMYYHSHLALGYFNKSVLWPISYLTEHGAFGVDVFFAISGYIICLVSQKPSFTLPSFFLKRMARIYPLSTAVTLGIVLIVFTIDLPLFDQFTGSQLLYSILLLPSDRSLNAVAWTLQYEVCFYIVGGLILRFASPAALLVYCVAAATFVYWQPIENTWIEHFFGSRYASFGAGVGAYLIMMKARTRKHTPLALLCFGLVMLHFGPLLAIPYSTSMAAGILVCSAAAWHTHSKPLTLLGDSSYALYLFHFPFFVCLNGLVWQLSPPQWTGELVRWGAMGFCLTASVASWRLLEKPINDAVGRCLNQRRQGVVKATMSVV